MACLQCGQIMSPTPKPLVGRLCWPVPPGTPPWATLFSGTSTERCSRSSTGAAGSHTHDVDGGSTDLSAGASHSVASGSDFTVPDHPNHAHGWGTLNTDSAADHAHSFSFGDHTHTLPSDTGSSSGGTSGTGNPPFLVVNYIIFTGVGV